MARTARPSLAARQIPITQRIGETQNKLTAKVATDPEGNHGIWAEMLADSIARNGDLRHLDRSN